MRHAAQIAAALLLVAMLMPIQLVSAEAPIGSRITFAEVATGTTTSLPGMELRGNQATDVVVLDAVLWIMYRASDRSRIATYHPDFTTDAWNISFEAYAPRTGNSYPYPDIGSFGLRAMISNGNEGMGLELCVGNRSSEGIYLIEGSSRTLMQAGILPAYPQGNTSEGQRPDRYIVSFENGAGVVTVTVRHSTAGVLLHRVVDFSANLPVIDFYADSEVKMSPGEYSRSIDGGWMMDDLTVRSAGTAYPTLPLLWSTLDRGAPVAVQLLDESGSAIDADVNIAGHSAQKNGSVYEVNYAREVDWCVPTSVEVTSGPVRFRDRWLLTTTTSAAGAQIAQWWGGYDWASVFGTDDCSGFSTVADVYRGLDHPLTAYVMSPSGSSSEILATQSELALHLPHDWLDFRGKNWAEAISMALSAHSQMNSYYSYASRWDDPSYVGRGDTYISMANPGSAASYEMMFAQYLAGTRIEGASSGQGDTVSGNYSLYGSWWVNGASWWDSANHSWQPARSIDMMDSQRQYSTDNGGAAWTTVQYVASQGGLLRVYNHMQSNPMQPASVELLKWIANPKTNSAPENWKTTDGEAASYVYARHTTSLTVNASYELGYDVQRQDPRNAGYWLVPVTVSIALGSSQVRSVKVIEHTANGDVVQELKPLNGKRVMDLGYDIRDGAVQVSAFFNASATIIVDTTSGDPHIINYPPTDAHGGETYSFLVSSTPSPSGRPLQWTFDNSTALWMQGEVAGDHSFLVRGKAVNGTFRFSLGVGITL